MNSTKKLGPLEVLNNVETFHHYCAAHGLNILPRRHLEERTWNSSLMDVLTFLLVQSDQRATIVNKVPRRKQATPNSDQPSIQYFRSMDLIKGASFIIFHDSLCISRWDWTLDGTLEKGGRGCRIMAPTYIAVLRTYRFYGAAVNPLRLILKISDGVC